MSIYRIRSERRETHNKYFAMRVHGGENVKYADDENPAYRLFIAHMYIVFRSLLFLQQKLKYGIRIGHGIAFNRILCANLSTPRHRKSSVLLAEMHIQAMSLIRTELSEIPIILVLTKSFFEILKRFLHF